MYSREQIQAPPTSTIAQLAAFARESYMSPLIFGEGEGLAFSHDFKASLLHISQASGAAYDHAPREELIATEYQRAKWGADSFVEVHGIELDEYLDFLHDQMPVERALADIEAQILGNYESFRPQVLDILGISTQYDEAPYGLPGSFIGEGSQSSVFKLDQEYVLRVPRKQPLLNVDAIVHGSALLKLHQIQGFEKVITASYGDAVTISEYVPGKNPYKYSDEEIANIPEYHYEALIRSVIIAQNHGVDCDFGVADNLIYHPQNGFTVIDYAHNGLWTVSDFGATPQHLIGQLEKLLFEEGPSAVNANTSSAAYRLAKAKFTVVASRLAEEYGDTPTTIPPIQYI